MLTPEIIAELSKLTECAQMQWFAMGQSWNAKDRADAYLYKLSQMFYESVAKGADVERTLDEAETNWRKYAAEQNKELKKASNLNYGPYMGQSSRMNSYVYPEKFGSTKIHLRNIVRILMNRHSTEKKACLESE